MARPLFEQYKDALRRGHLALLGDELEAALEAYREAASLVPDRPLPYASIGQVLARLGRPEEAIVAYDQALALDPDEPAVVDARAAIATAVPPLGASTGPAAAPSTVEEPSIASTREQAEDASVDANAAADATAAVVAPAADEAGSGQSGNGSNPSQPADGAWPAVDLPSLPEPVIDGPPPDPLRLEVEATIRLDAGDPAAARDLWLTAVGVHRAEGRLDAAIDACLELLAIAPGDPRVHLAIANLQLDRGWDQVATEKIELLLRLTSLSGDVQAEADVHLLAADRLRDESPTRLDARRRGLPAG